MPKAPADRPPTILGFEPWRLLAELPSALVLTDNGTVRWWNQRATNLLGLTDAAMAGLTVSDLRARAEDRDCEASPLPGVDGAMVLEPTRDRDSERLTLFAQASEALAGSLNLDRTLSRVAHLAVPRLADGCLISFADGRNLLRVGLLDGDGVVWHQRQSDLPLKVAIRSAARVRSTGKSELWPSIESTDITEFVPPGEQWRPLREFGGRSAMVVPLRGRGAPIGALVLLGGHGRRPYDDLDISVAEGLAHRAAVAIDNALIYRERSHVARVLQDSLLPAALPEVPALELGARYHPLTSGSEIGGDFYDVFATGADSWAIVVGDVCGKGVQAATLTGLARHTIRAVAGHLTDPAEVLRSLNEAVREQRTDTFCTVAFARAVATPTGVAITLATGGHPPALVLRADGQVSALETSGTLLGMLPEVRFETTTTELVPGDSLVLYTDGLVEARSGQREFGQVGLRQSLAACVDLDADIIADRLVRDVTDFVGGAQTDDIAVVVARVRPAENPSVQG